MSNTERRRIQKPEFRSRKLRSATLSWLMGRRARVFILASGFCLLASGCRQDMQDQPRYEVYEGSKFFADGQASRPYVEGTVPRGYLREDTAFYQGRRGISASGQPQGLLQTTSPNVPGGGQAAGGGDVNVRGNAGGPVGVTTAGGTQGAAARDGLVNEFPFPITEQDLNRGQERYGIYCALCHGATGFGDGMIVRRGFRRPPSFHDDRLRGEPLGHFFDVITNGWGAMASYSDAVPPDDRWRIIAYLRTLQLSRQSNGATGATGGPNAGQQPAPGGVSPEAGGPRPGGTPQQGSGGGHR